MKTTMKLKSQAPAKKPLTRGEKVIAFIERFCKVPEGVLVGKLIRLLPFQKKFILDLYDNPNGTSRAILCIARKNGKTALIACLLLAHIVGPEAKRNSQIISGAKSREQASLVFKLACKMIDLSPELRLVCHYVPSRKEIFGKPMNVEYKALSADASTAHGLSPVLGILDEVGQIRGSTDPFIEAITTSQGAHENPLLIAISTQAPSDADLLSQWIDDALRSGDPHTVCHLYAADPDCDLMDVKQWKKANPALGVFRSEKDLRNQLQEAARLPVNEASVRNLCLNQRIAAESLWLAPTVWKKCSTAPDLEVFRENPVCVGLDLSSRRDLTAAVLAAKDENGMVHLLPYVFTPSLGIEERARIDKAPYDRWRDMGVLKTTPGPTVDYEWVAQFLALEFDTLGIYPSAVAFDRWRIEAFKKASEAHGFATDAEWVPVGQGYKDISPRMEAFENLLLQGAIAHGAHPLMNLAASHAIAVSDPAGNKKLDKSKATQRIDPLVAAIMAVFQVSDGSIEEAVDVSTMILA
jgi:phage terminase large subunit-like protein